MTTIGITDKLHKKLSEVKYDIAQSKSIKVTQVDFSMVIEELLVKAGYSK